MPRVDRLEAEIAVHVPIVRSPRVQQLEGLFDIPPSERAVQSWSVSADLPQDWRIGLIVGPSGSGKSTLARTLWPESVVTAFDWPHDRSIVDGFPSGMSIKRITELLSSVGFSSPPAWMKPFRVLSNGEQFRVTIARTLSELPELAVVDEFSSVVDRQVARIASAAIARTVRRAENGQRFVAVTCHYDVAEWLEPDWIYQPHTGEFTTGRLLRRPPIELEIVRVHRSAWEIFKRHHYLSAELMKSAYCFVALVAGQPAAFASARSFPHPTRSGWHEHRTVCLPDYQGIGIGAALSNYVASLFAATGKPYRSTTTHPAFVRARLRSPLWKITRAPSITKKISTKSSRGALQRSRARNRFAASFEYVGPIRLDDARQFGLPIRSGIILTN